MIWVERGACLLLCLAHLLGLLGPSIMLLAIWQGAARSGPAHRLGFCWLWWGLGPHLTAHADWLVCSARLPRVLLLAGGAGKEGPSSVLRHTALLQNPDCMGPLCVSVYGVLLQWRAGARVCCSIGIGRADLTCSTCSQALLCGLSCSCE